MKEKVSILIFLFVFTCFSFLTCEKDKEPGSMTNKLKFSNVEVDSVSYREAKISYELENLDKNNLQSLDICYNTSGEPTRENSTVSLTISSSGNKKINGLSPDTKYYFRLYTVLDEASKYWEENTFTTQQITRPELKTTEITDTTAKAAKSGGEILDKNGGAINKCGICWNTNGSPTIDHTTTVDTLRTNTFNSQLDSLHFSTTYYVRAYATNEAGTAYGNEISFTTKDGLAKLTTHEVTDITYIEAKSGGNISENGGYEIDKRGVCWSKSSGPTLEDHATEDGSGIGKFTSTLSGLDKNSVYFVRAYATNEPGVAYGNEIEFTTNDMNMAVSTDNISNITANSALSGGSIVNSSSYSITARGVCWNNTGNPTVSDNKTENGSGDGDFNSSLSGLNYSTTYYVRAYATHDAGTVYGEEKELTTLDGIPSLTTQPASNITPSSAESGGDITENDGLSIQSRGICWNTNGNPDTDDNTTTDGSGTGSYTSDLTGLSLNTTYYVRAYATTDAGTGYGDEITFSVGGKPSVSTSSISGIDGASAESGGNVTDDGGFSVTEKGICWSTSSNPTMSDNTTTNGSGTGSYSSSITGLSTSTTYYVRAYATNDAGTVYGEEKTFTTTDGLPEVTTNEVTNIDINSAKTGGNITDNGGFPVTVRGICWSTSQNPTINDNHTTNGSGTGSFTSEMTGLTEGTTYYVRAYATNETGTAFGEEKSFTALQLTGTFTDSRDGQTYEWVRIGDQVWMAENLNYDQNSYGNDWCYDNDQSNCDTYGRLYDWNAVMQGEGSSNSNPSSVQGVCPDGWHVPSDDEWTELAEYISNDNGGYSQDGDDWNNVGNHLKATSGWGSSYNGADDYGFSGLPGGKRTSVGDYREIGYDGYWWSTKGKYLTATAWLRSLNYNSEFFYRFNNSKDIGFSVRCIKD
jgi:uncharacterized protein (TIGR02145 family)